MMRRRMGGLLTFLMIQWAINGTAPAIAQERVRIGVLNDQSGVYAAYQGIGSVIAAQMAVADFGGKVANRVIEVISGDHQNKPDIGLTIARRWYEVEEVDAIFDVPNTSIALPIADMARRLNKVFVGSGAGSAILTGEQCSPNTVHWTYDTYAYGFGLARAAALNGGKNWFFVTVDYAFGADMEAQATKAVLASGGRLLGKVRHPLGTSDFASYLLQAQASGADTIGLANAGDDTINTIKQAAEFGLTKTQKLIAFGLALNSIPSLTLKVAHGTQLLSPFYWDMSEGTRQFARRFSALHPLHAYPNEFQAGVYAAVLHYLKAVQKAGSASDGAKVVAAMKSTETDDPLFGKGYIRADGRKIHPLYVLEVKDPDDSKEPWDLLKVVGTIRGEDAFRPEAEGNCPLSKNQK